MTELMTAIIYHMAPLAMWQAQLDRPVCASPSLVQEGFILCTAEPERLEQVANQFYQESPGSFIIACIAVERLDVELRWERADGHLFPHIYGPLNRSAVVSVLPFPRSADHRFVLPQELRDLSV